VIIEPRNALIAVLQVKGGAFDQSRMSMFGRPIKGSHVLLHYYL